MQKLLAMSALLVFLSTPVLAKDTTNATPNQDIENTKSYTGINYNRQDSEQVGKQKIVNDHSWFNINVQIIKKGALFKSKDVVVGEENK
jgi:hypothetical protein